MSDNNTTWIFTAAKDIIADLDDRKGLTDGIDDDVREEILNMIINKITQANCKRSKPDVLIVSTNHETMCFSNKTDMIGKVLFWEPDVTYEGAVETADLKPAEINGDAVSWTAQVDETTDNMDKFLENFILRNS